MEQTVVVNGSCQEPCRSSTPRAYSQGWIFAFVVNVLIVLAMYFSHISIINQFKNAAVDTTLPDLSDCVLKFSVLYLLTRYQLSLKTFSDSLVGQALAWIVSILVNLVVSDLLMVLVWRPFAVLLSTSSAAIAAYMDRNTKPTYVMMGLSQYFKLMAANHLKFAVAFYFLYRCLKSLILCPHSPVIKKLCGACPRAQPEQCQMCTQNQRSSRSRRRSRSRQRSRSLRRCDLY